MLSVRTSAADVIKLSRASYVQTSYNSNYDNSEQYLYKDILRVNYSRFTNKLLNQSITTFSTNKNYNQFTV